MPADIDKTAPGYICTSTYISSIVSRNTLKVNFSIPQTPEEEIMAAVAMDVNNVRGNTVNNPNNGKFDIATTDGTPSQHNDGSITKTLPINGNGEYPKSRVSLIDRFVDEPRKLRVVVIGGGLAGILAGCLLPEKVPGIELVIYEKNPDFVSWTRLLPTMQIIY